MLTEPSIGAVFIYLGTLQKPTKDRYIILEVERRTGKVWSLDLVGVATQTIYRRHAYDSEVGNVTFEPLADGEECLFFQAMIAPQTLEECAAIQKAQEA